MSLHSEPVKSTTEYLGPDAIMRKIELAADRLEGAAHRTPVLTSRTLNKRVDASVFLKCEQFQRVGAFKFRGAFNALSALTPQERERGVLTYSSGNHAQAMALASTLLNIQLTVVMPENAPPAKLAATREYGANVVTFDPRTATREDVAAELPQAAEAILIPPFDHYEVIAGQGTCARELHQQQADSGHEPLDTLLVPVGGGGLLAGTAVATRFLSAGTQVIGVEPANADDAARSFKEGRIIRLDHIDTIADGTRTPAIGQRNFRVIRELVTDIVTVSEQAIADAVQFLFERLNVVVEPSGALGVAALLEGAVAPGSNAGVILSGGNVDAALFADIISRRFQPN